MDLQHKQKLYMQQWAEQKGEATVAALTASGSLGGPPGVGPTVGAAPPGTAVYATCTLFATHMTSAIRHVISNRPNSSVFNIVHHR